MTRRAKGRLPILGLLLLFGCGSKEAPEVVEEPKSHIQPGYMAQVRKIGVKYPEKRGRIYSGYTMDEDELAQMVELNLAELAISEGTFQVADHTLTSEVLRKLKESVSGFAEQTEAERFRRASQVCGLDAYVDIDVVESDLGSVEKSMGCLWGSGSTQSYAQLAGRAYLVDVKTGAIVGVKRFQCKFQGKSTHLDLRREAIMYTAEEIVQWLLEEEEPSGSGLPPLS